MSRIVKCDRCEEVEEEDAPLPEGRRPIMEVRLSLPVTMHTVVASAHLCETCRETEAQSLQRCALTRGAQFSLHTPFRND